MMNRTLRAGCRVGLLFALVGLLPGQTIADKAGVAALQYKADHGDAKAQYDIGLLYHEGKFKERNPVEAVRWFQKAADQGHSEAALILGQMYAEGDGITKDPTQAAHYYHIAADHGHSLGQFPLGMAYYNGDGVSQDYTEAAHWLRAAGDQGQVGAQFILGAMYFEGKYLRKDWGQAAALLRTPGDNGEIAAQRVLGKMYLEGGFGVSQDYVESARWLKRAAKQGDAYSQFLLGSLFWMGNGVPQDPVTAHMWFNLAAAGGWQAARRSLNDAEQQMTEAQLTEARRLAREWSALKEK